MELSDDEEEFIKKTRFSNKTYQRSYLSSFNFKLLFILYCGDGCLGSTVGFYFWSLHGKKMLNLKTKGIQFLPFHNCLSNNYGCLFFNFHVCDFLFEVCFHQWRNRSKNLGFFLNSIKISIGFDR
jgi:hypothetical protein